MLCILSIPGECGVTYIDILKGLTFCHVMFLLLSYSDKSGGGDLARQSSTTQGSTTGSTTTTSSSGLSTNSTGSGGVSGATVALGESSGGALSSQGRLKMVMVWLQSQG